MCYSGRANWIVSALPGNIRRQAKDRGLVRQVGRGLYLADGSRVTEHHTLVEGEFVMPVAAGILKGNSEKKVWQPGGPWKKGRKL
jgi:hypothetical protein